MNFKKTFHLISYLQYPLMLIAIYFIFSPYLLGMDTIKESPDIMFKSYNRALIFIGLAVSFSSLQDTTKTQNKFSRKVYENPKKGKAFIKLMCLLILLFLTLGMIGYFNSIESNLKDLSVGLLVLGLGMFGFLKSIIEMFENHRLDKK